MLGELQYALRVFSEVVVLPESNVDTTTTSPPQAKSGGSINTETNFDCTKINLRRGSKGDDVRKLQTILKARGYYTRQIDGSYGYYTVQAVKKLQRAQGNTADGWFGQKTCQKLQSTSTITSIDAQNTTNVAKSQKNNSLLITNFTEKPSMSYDLEGLSNEVSVTIPYSEKMWHSLRQLQKTEFTITQNNKKLLHMGYINSLKIDYNDGAYKIGIGIIGYNAFLEQSVSYERTAKRSELLQDLITMAGLKADIDMSGLPDTEFTVKAVKETSSSGSDSVSLSGNDCQETINISARSFDIATCKGDTKIGNSNANYAKDTKGMTGKEAIMDVYNRFHYGISLSSSKEYLNNRRCPQAMWSKTGKFWGNCADVSRLVKAVGEVHGMRVGIRHMSGHYYNLIEVEGKTYRFDCCCKSTGSYNKEITNTLTKRGGPWS